MFDIGFWELLIVGVIALLVIGPERLPIVASKVGRIMGRVNYFIGKFKDDINLEVKSAELKATLAKQKESLGLHEIINDLDDEKQSIKAIRDELHADADPEMLASLDTKDKTMLDNEVSKPSGNQIESTAKSTPKFKSDT